MEGDVLLHLKASKTIKNNICCGKVVIVDCIPQIQNDEIRKDNPEGDG